MRVLFLDDSIERQRRFQMHRIGCILVQAFTYAEAVHALQGNPRFDEAHLDHDLSDVAAAGQPARDEKTGADVAQFIAEMSEELRPKKIFLHSFNPHGRARMAQILRDVGIQATIAPYGLLGS